MPGHFQPSEYIEKIKLKLHFEVHETLYNKEALWGAMGSKSKQNPDFH